MPATARGVYHNLKESKYTVSNSEVVFFFSSKVYMEKFLSRYKQNRQEFEQKIERVADDVPYNLDMWADLSLYEDIERRGFRAKIKGVETDCDGIYKYALRKMTEPNTLDWCVTQERKLGVSNRITT